VCDSNTDIKPSPQQNQGRAKPGMSGIGVLGAASDLQVVQLVPLLSKVDAPQVCASPPKAQALIQVQDGDVGKVRDASNSLKHPEALDGPAWRQTTPHTSAVPGQLLCLSKLQGAAASK
jgi:hypothetical protein